MNPKNWTREFSERIPDDEAVFVEPHKEYEIPKFIISVKKDEIPEIYETFRIISSHHEIYFFDSDFKVIKYTPYTMLFDRQKAQDAVYDLFKAAQFGLELVKLSEVFDINIGKGWQDFKNLAEPGVQRAKGEI